MSLDNVSESRPHLKDVFTLYTKVREFDHIELRHDYNRIDSEYNRYIGEDIDNVVDEFSEIFSLSPEHMESIKEGMRSGIIDFMLLAQGEVAAFSTPFMSEEMQSLLYILSRPFFHSIKRGLNVDNIFWEEGRCPTCNSVPSLSVIAQNDKRKYSCSFCGTIGYYKRIGCPSCHNEDTKLIDIMYVGDKNENEGLRLDTCKSCKSYIKTFNENLLTQYKVEEIDLLSLPLDIVAQGKGFVRRSPNPVGILRVT